MPSDPRDAAPPAATPPGAAGVVTPVSAPSDGAPAASATGTGLASTVKPAGTAVSASAAGAALAPGGAVASSGVAGAGAPVSAVDLAPCAVASARAKDLASSGTAVSASAAGGPLALGGTTKPRARPPAGFATVVGALVRACHPEPTAAVAALMAGLAAASGQTAGGCVVVAVAVLAGQLSVGWSNDLLDRERDAVARRTDKPLVAGAVSARTVWMATGAALLVCVLASLACGPAAGAAHLTGVAAAWAYNAGVKRTLWSWLPYTVGFGLLPVFVTLGLPARTMPPGWSVAAGALLGVGAHLTNVLPDIEADLATGVRGLPQRLGRRRSRLLAPAPLLGAAGALVFGPPGPPGAAGWTALAVTGAAALATVAPAAARPHARLPFLATLAMAATSVVLLLLRGHALA
ncbi:UbiA family prenyltransferase [Streptomyces sp. V4-01]|uniref:UbiA family prenyltransferase n=1 Tax=Actinacidiphila polyblastidii TaxID=3110430 RepID=A0ABU7P3Y3_9ACTN|nr:UbiA family prenyltransferase [Streptomyces sp. V4-01]